MTILSDCGEWGSVIWPWPRLFFLEHYTLGVAVGDYAECLGSSAEGDSLILYEFSNVSYRVVATPVSRLSEFVNTTAINAIEVADFGPFYIVSSFNHANPSYIGRNLMKVLETGVVADITDYFPEIPRFTACCNYNGQLIIGGILHWNYLGHRNYDGWSDLTRSHVAWSGIGNFTFRPDEDPTAGFAKVWWSKGDTGLVLSIKKIGENVLVFGDYGIMRLEPYSTSAATGFSPKKVNGPGLASNSNVAGNEDVLLFLNRDNDLCITEDGVKIEVLGYREYMEVLDSTNIIINYVPQKKRFYISDGVYGYCLTEHGLYSTHQLVTSAGMFNNQLIGFFKDSADYEARFETNTLDFKQRGKKTLETVELGVQYVKGSSTAKLSTKYKNAFSSGTFTETTAKLLNPNGIAYPIITADEFRILGKFSDYRSSDFNISYLKGKYKMVDKRSIRGIYNAN